MQGKVGRGTLASTHNLHIQYVWPLLSKTIVIVSLKTENEHNDQHVHIRFHFSTNAFILHSKCDSNFWGLLLTITSLYKLRKLLKTEKVSILRFVCV